MKNRQKDLGQENKSGFSLNLPAHHFPANLPSESHHYPVIALNYSNINPDQMKNRQEDLGQGKCRRILESSCPQFFCQSSKAKSHHAPVMALTYSYMKPWPNEEPAGRFRAAKCR